MRTKLALRFVGVGLFACGFAGSAVAQDDDTARARELFNEGISLVDQGEWEQAVDRFRQTLELRQSSAVAYNLAFALKHLGQLVEATELLRGVMADAAAARGLRNDAQNLLNEVEPLLAHLTVNVEGADAFDVTLDGNPYPSDQIGIERAVDPGSHMVALLVGGRELSNEAVSLTEGGHAEVTLSPPRAPTPRETAEADSELPPGMGGTGETGALSDNGSDDEGVLGAWWFWTGIGLVAVGTVIAVVLITSSGGGAADPVAGDLGVFELEVMP